MCRGSGAPTIFGIQRPEVGDHMVSHGISPIRMMASAAHLPLWQEAEAFARRDELARSALWRVPPIDAGGQPLLLVGGMGGTPQLLAPLLALLTRLGFRCVVAPVRMGFGCGEATVGLVEPALRRVVDAAGVPAIVVAHSRGGQFARAVTVRRPDLVRGLVTMGSPLTRMLAVHPLIRIQCGLLGLGGALGLCGLMRPGCLWGACCAGLRRDLVGPFPDGLPFTSIYSKEDGIVAWQSCLDPAARHVEVRASHGGLLWSPASVGSLVDELRPMLDSSAAVGGGVDLLGVAG
jgi:hypothetical protein